MEKKDYLVTVAICTYRRFDLLKGCLECIKDQTISQNQYEIIVVDNSLQPERSRSFRDSLEGFEDLNYVITEKCGIAYARNVALEICKAPIILFTDDDVRVPPNWCEDYITLFNEYPTAGVIGGRVDPIWPTPPPKWLAGKLLHLLAVLNWDFEGVSFVTEDKWLITANAGYRVKALRVGGGFCEQLGRKGNLPFWHAELGANLAIKDSGYDLLYTPHIKVGHMIESQRMKKTWFYRQQIYGGASMAAVHWQKENDLDFDVLSKEIETSYIRLLRKIRTSSENTDDVLKDLDIFQDEGYKICLNQLNIDPNKTALPRITFFPVIYIVTPCINAVDTIDRTIICVLTQAGDFSIRYHIQDGGSTDGTMEKIKQWEKRLNDKAFPLSCKNVVFSYASAPDQGMYDAISKGFASMYIPPNAFMTWISANDILMKNAFTTVMRVSKQLPDVHWLGGDVTAFFPEENCMLPYPVGFPQEVIQEGLCDGLNWQTLQQEGMFWRGWIWDKVGGVNTKLKYAGDWDLWRRFAQNVELIHVPWTMGVFYANKGQFSTSDGGNAYQKEINSLLSFDVRRTALKHVSENVRNGFNIAMLARDFNSNNLFINHIPLGDRLPDQVKEFFQQKRTKKYGNEVKDSFDVKFSPSLPKRTFVESGLLRNIYDALHPFIKSRLRWVKNCLILPMMHFPKKWWEYIVILRSELFFFSYYLRQYQDVAESGINPIFHYILFGGKEGRKPNPLFDSHWYLKTYPDVANAGISPLFHYIKCGEEEGRDPSPTFSTNGYLSMNPDVRETGMNSLRHYLKHGIFEGRPTI